MIRFHACAAFLVALAYVVVGAIRWHQPLGDGGDLLLRVTAGVLVYGNLLWLLQLLLALPLRRWPRLALGLPTALVVTGAVAFEQAVAWNIEFPSLVPLRDPERVSVAIQAVLVGLLPGVAAGLFGAWMAGRFSWARGCENGSSSIGRNRWPGVLLMAQGLLAVAVTGWNSATLNVGRVDRARASTRSPDTDRTLALFCIDAGMWTILDRFIDEGHMPNLAALKQRSSYGHLMTHGQRLSPIVWTSLVTGMAESRHGIHGFTELSKDGDRRSVPTPSSSRTAAALWNVATAAGLKSLVVNWLVTAPPEAIDGVVIPNLRATLAGSVPSTHPPAVRSSIEKIIAEYPGSRSGDAYVDAGRLLDIEIDVYEVVSRTAEYDLVVTGTQASDSVLHHRYLHTFPEQFDLGSSTIGPKEISARAGDAPAIFSRIDEWLGEIVAEGRAVMVVSDHGARPRVQPLTIFHLNVVLADMGLIEFPGDDFDRSSFRFDPERARAYEAGDNALASQVGFFFQEEVTEGVSDLSLDEVLEGLRSLRLQETGEPLFHEVLDLSTDERFPQLRSIGAAGVVVVSKLLREPPGERTVEVGGRVRPLARYVDLPDDISGNHDPHGMFLFAAPDVQPRGPVAALCSGTSFSTLLGFVLGTSKQVDRIAELARRMGLFEPYSSLDVAPTVLAYLGLPVARDMDGRTMGRVLGSGGGVTRSVGSYSDLIDPNRAQEPVDDASRQEILEQLRALGYIR